MKKVVIYSSIVLLMTAIAFPLTAEAFSRRPNSSEVYQGQQVRQLPSEAQDNRPDQRKPHAVPESSPLVLMGIASIGLGILQVIRKRVHGVVEK